MAGVKRFETRKRLSTRGGFGLPIYLSSAEKSSFPGRASAHLLVFLLMFFSSLIIGWLLRSSRLGILEGAGFVVDFFCFFQDSLRRGEERRGV